MAIQLRRGDYADFDPSQLLDGELAVVLENDPDTDDGTGLYACFGDDNVKRLAFADETSAANGNGIYYAGSISNPTNGCFTVTVDESFELVKGVAILTYVSGTYTDYYYAALNVNSTGQKMIMRRYGPMMLGNIESNARMLLIYNGAYWELASELDGPRNSVLTGTSSTVAATAIKNTDIIYDGDQTGMIVIVTFSYDNTASLSNLQLSIIRSSGTGGASKIRKNGAVLTEADNLKANIPYVFRFDGVYWQLIGALPTGVIAPSSTAPAMDGTASAGSSTDYARADHVHPTDTSRASASDLSAHTGDTTVHVTAAERTTWNAKASTDTATTSANGLMSASDKTKLDGIESGANAYELPPMSPTTRGGARLGSGLAMDGDVLSVALDAESDGSDAGPIVELTAKGWATQDGTPTPDSPVEIQVARGRNLYVPSSDIRKSACTMTLDGDEYVITATGADIYLGTYTSNAGVDYNSITHGTLVPVEPLETYTLSTTDGRFTKCYATFFDSAQKSISGTPLVNLNPMKFTTPVNTAYVTFRIGYDSAVSGTTYRTAVQLELGSVATPYVPYGCVGVDVYDGSTHVSTIPVPLPSRGWVGALPDGTADALVLDGAGKVVWEEATNQTTQAVTDGVTGTVGVDVLSSTGQIADGATVLYKLATPVTEDMGYVDLPEIPEGCVLSIAELDALNVRYVVDDAAVTLARHWYERARSEYEGRLSTLESIVAGLV